MEKFVEIDQNIHDNFMQTSMKEHFMQHSLWADAKKSSGWANKIVGLYIDEQLVASSLLLFRKIPVIGSYVCYAPRGYVIDFDNMELVEKFTSNLIQYCKKNNVCYIMIDPDVVLNKTDSKGEIVEQRPDFVSNMEKLGYKHQGYSTEFELTQPRFTYRLQLNKTKEEIFKDYSKVVRSSMNNATRIGIKCNIEDNIDKFYDIMQDTAIRNNFVERNKEYYQQIYDSFKDQGMATCYTATYYGQSHLEAMNEKKNELLNERNKCEEKLVTSPSDTKSSNRIKQIDIQLDKMKHDYDKVNKFIEDYPEGLTLSSGLTIKTKHRAWLVYGGNLSIMREVGANYAIKQFEIEDDIALGYEFVDFFGTCKEPVLNKEYSGIHEFKKRFSGDYYEFSGEFHYVINKFYYGLWIHLVPFAKQCFRKLKRR